MKRGRIKVGEWVRVDPRRKGLDEKFIPPDLDDVVVIEASQQAELAQRALGQGPRLEDLLALLDRVRGVVFGRILRGTHHTWRV